jgi:D-3-phosphoglycerate dehydrogenase
MTGGRSHERILVTESVGFSATAAAALEELGVVTMADIRGRPELLALAANATVLWVRLRHLIDAEVLDAAPRLRCIVTPTTGLNHIDAAAAAAHATPILSLFGATEFLRDVRATAEHTLALILALLRHLPAAAAKTASGGWERDSFRGMELYGKTVGLVGYGRIGRIVARYLRAFDCNVLATDPALSSSDVDDGTALVSLVELLRTADIVSIHASYSPASHGFFGSAEINAMRPGAWLVNTARGELIDSDALLAALRSGRMAGAALDVLAAESSVTQDHPLMLHARTHENLILTPHIGGCTVESMEKTERYMVGRLREFLRQDLPTVTPLQR